MKKFKIFADMTPSGDQPKAIDEMVANIKKNIQNQALLGVTGSGKTFSMAKVIERTNLPALILAPNKTLAAQLFGEFKELFPENAVGYFVSYYDYYQPEAYIPSSGTFIEKDSSINEQIDQMRHSVTRSLLERKDIIIVSSVSCIYGLGSPETYEDMVVHLNSGSEIRRDSFLKELIRIQYNRNDVDFDRGRFRVRGDVVEIFPPYEEFQAVRVEFFGNCIDRISIVDALRGDCIKEVEKISIYPGSHYVSTEEKTSQAMGTIREELRQRIVHFKDQIMHQEAERIEQRTLYDLEIMQEMSFCPGIENYSRHFTGRGSGEPPPTLLEYFPEEFITFIDESHITVPQIGGMYKGDRSRKTTLVEHGFRLPSALDNRPLNFQEFESYVDKVVYVSATPSEYELKKSEGVIVEQIIRPTGLLDPEVEVRPATYQVDDLLLEIKKRVKKNERVLVTTLTKRSSEDLTDYYDNLGIKVKYLHSDIKTIERTEILRDLRMGVFDVLIGINLLREGLDLPEVSLVAITDADKEGFLRSTRALIQTIGRAARNVNGRVILYANHRTRSIDQALLETDRRRAIQREYNKKHKITPKGISKPIKKGLLEIYGLDNEDNRLVDEEKLLQTPKKLSKEISKLKKEMKTFADALDFEEAARLRDKIKRLQVLELEKL